MLKAQSLAPIIAMITRSLLLVLFSVSACAQHFQPAIPKAWDEEALHSMQLPLIGLGEPPTEVPATYYYQLRTKTVYKSYPFYHPDREPPGYYDWLQQQEPHVVAFDPVNLKTKADWVSAGEAVFKNVHVSGRDPRINRKARWTFDCRSPDSHCKQR
jgi:hypothetical protein